jgi:DNA-binding beta-propeller fold protein YncE
MRPLLRLTTALLLYAGCQTSTMVKPPPPSPGDGTIKDLTPAATASAMSFRTPLDAALSPDGKRAYFIALQGDEAGVFASDAPSTAAPSQLHAGAPLVSPFGIDVSLDGKTLVVADPGAQLDLDQPERGELFTVSASGSAPSKITGASGYRPRGVVVMTESNTEQIYFTGKEPTTGQAGVFKLPLAGGAVTVVAKGAAFVDPSGVAVASDGTAYVVDASDPEGSSARLLKVSAGTVSVMLGSLAVGYPAGVALSQDEKTVLVSALDPQKRTDAVLRVPVAGGEFETVSSGIDTFQEPAGLHRARNADTFIWADSRANAGGTVYVINKQP